MKTRAEKIAETLAILAKQYTKKPAFDALATQWLVFATKEDLEEISKIYGVDTGSRKVMTANILGRAFKGDPCQK